MWKDVQLISITFFTSGRSNPIYGIMSFGSVTSEHILPTICAAFFLVSALLSLKPLCTIGTSKASEGASIELTKVVCSKQLNIEAQTGKISYIESTKKKREKEQYSSDTLLGGEYQVNILYSHWDL